MGISHWRRVLAAAVALLCAVAAPVSTAAPISGDPPFTRIAPDVDGFLQAFDAIEGPDSLIYLAHSTGVLIHDGRNWSEVPSPNQEIVRSLDHDGDSRLYVGGFDAFGYIATDATGQSRWEPLSDRIGAALNGESFADIWHTLVTPHGVFFIALHHAFRYDPATDQLQHWQHAQRYGAIAMQGNELLLQFRGEGMRRWNEGSWQPIAGTESLSELIFALVPHPDGGLLSFARDGHWRHLHANGVSTLDLPGDFPPSNRFSAGHALADGRIAAAGDDGLMYLLDISSGRFETVRIDSGYLTSLRRSADGDLLLCGQDAVFHLPWPAPWSMVGPDHGLKGPVHHVRRWGARWFALTGSGIQEAIPETDGRRMLSRDWASSEAWDLLPIDDEVALLADSYGLLEVRRNAPPRAALDDKLYVRRLLRSSHDPQRIYAGTEHGLALLHGVPGQWTLRDVHHDAGNPRYLDLLEVDAHTLLVGTERDGLHRVRLSADGNTIDSVEALGAEHGISYGPGIASASVARDSAGRVLVSTPAGLFLSVGHRFEPEALDGLNALRGEDEWLSLRFSEDGEAWAYGHRSLYHRAKAQAWKSEPIGGFMQGVISSLELAADGTALLAGSSQILIRQAQNPTVRPAPKPGPRVLLRSVSRVLADGSEQRLPLADDAAPVLAEDDQRLSFLFAMPDHHRPDAVRFQMRLNGGDNPRWSDWQYIRRVAYSALGAGDYEFQIRGRDSLNRVSAVRSYAFRIAAPWYRESWAMLAWAICGLLLLTLLIWSITWLRTRRMRAHLAQLERLVTERTAELRSANARLDEMAHLDALTKVPNRRRLDDYLRAVWAQCAERERPLSILIIDVDHFKRYNDSHGHLAGDVLLVRLANLLRPCLRRAEDLFARYGGDEFNVILPGAAEPVALALAETMRKAIVEDNLGVTISIGVACHYPEDAESVEQWLSASDKALYRAKQAGRNQVAAALPQDHDAAPNETG